MFTDGSFVLFIKATTTTSPLVTPPPSPSHSSVDHGQHAGHRPELYASLLYYFTARYFTHDQCGELKNSDFRGEISYFTHELYAQNCINKFGKYWIQYFFREFLILYREKSIRSNTYQYFFFRRDFHPFSLTNMFLS